MSRSLLLKIAVLCLAFVMPLAPVASRAADGPLTTDDVRLLLIGGASTRNIIALVEKRGVNFRMNPDLAKKFHDDGAEDAVIEALQRAGERMAASAPAAAQTKPAAAPTSPPGSAAPAEAPRQTAPQLAPAASSAPNPVPAAAAISSAGRPAVSNNVSAKSADLTDPSPEQVQRIIQEFAAKEKIFREARNNYTYHQINKVQELDPDGNVAGMYEQDWDIVFDDSGKRLEQVTYAPIDSLKNLIVTQEDLTSMRNIQPFVLTTDELPEYDVKYLGHVKVDEISAYVFNIRPKEIVKGHQYFQGIVWVDDRDLQIVKSEGKPVPELRTKKGANLFPRFVTYREQIDGKFWFPTFTIADDTLYFPGQPVHIKEVIKYSDYKQFKSTSTFRVVKNLPPGGEPSAAPGSAPPKNSPKH